MSPISLELSIALRYLGSKRKEVFISIITVISVIGVAVSVMVLDMVLAIMTGFEVELKQKLVNANAHVLVQKRGGDLEGWDELADEVAQVAGVTSVVPFTQSQAMISHRGQTQGVYVRGLANRPAAIDKFREFAEANVDVESLFRDNSIEVRRPDSTKDFVTLPSLLVGQSLMRQLRINTPQPVTVFSAELTNSPNGLVPKMRRFIVTGAFESSLAEFEKGLVYTDLEDAQRFFGFGKAITALEVSVDDVFRAREIADNIVKHLGGALSGFYAIDWAQSNQALWDALQLEKTVYNLVLLLLILVASFSIVSSMVMIVMEKTKDIAIMKVIGARDSSVMRVFLWQGFIIGAVGTFIGTILGYLGCWALRHFGFDIDATIFSMDKVPVQIDPMNFALVALSSLVITSFAGIYPAWRASKISPADAMRYE